MNRDRQDREPVYADPVRRQVVEVCGIPVELDESLPAGTFAIRMRDGRVLGQWETATVQNDPAVASFVAHRLLDNDDGRYVPVSGPGDPPAGVNLVGLGPLERHLAAGGTAGTFDKPFDVPAGCRWDPVPPQPAAEIHRPRLRQLAPHLWIDVDEIIAIETRCDGNLGWPERRVVITTRGGDTHSVIVPGTMRDELDADGKDPAAYDAAADAALTRWLDQRFGDIIGSDTATLHGLSSLFGVDVDGAP